MGTIARAALLAAGLALASTGVALAQGSFLDQGRNMLQGLGSGGGGAGGALATGEIIAGLRDALTVGTERVVSTVGREDGFNGDPDIHIPLPGALKNVQQALRAIGASGMADEVELKLNRAAEAAAPEAKRIFVDAITAMSVEDARGILNGPKDSATQYFRGKMTDPLRDAMRPVVDSSLADVGAVQSYDAMMGRYRSLPFVPDVKANLTDHVLGGALDGIFLYLAREEAAIRENPAKRTTDIMRKVFGAAG